MLIFIDPLTQRQSPTFSTQRRSPFFFFSFVFLWNSCGEGGRAREIVKQWRQGKGWQPRRMFVGLWNHEVVVAMELDLWWTCVVGLCFCVSVYDLTHVFIGLIFWVWEIGTHVLFFFFFDKVYLVFLWRRKERKRTKKKKKNVVGVSLWRRKKERKRKNKKEVCLTWLVSGHGSHECVFNYKNAIENWVLKTENT